MEQFVSLRAAADSMSNGAIIVPEFQTEIVDLVRRAGEFGKRIQYVPATGTPSRFFEQSDIVDGTFVAPNSINPTTIDLSALRLEKSVQIKAIQNEIGYNLFDMETVAQQGVFTQLKAKDMADMVKGILRARDKALWIGTDTVNGNSIGNSGVQFVGVLAQVSKTAIITNAASIVDGLRTQVASLVTDSVVAARPTAIYIHPMALDALEQEVKNSPGAIKFINTNLTGSDAGLNVTGLVTVAGTLPLIAEPFLTMNASVGATPVAAAPAGQNNYPFAIVTEELVEFHYVGEKIPRVFQLGTLANLKEQYVGILFGAPAVKYAAKGHVVGVIQF